MSNFDSTMQKILTNDTLLKKFLNLKNKQEVKQFFKEIDEDFDSGEFEEWFSNILKSGDQEMIKNLFSKQVVNPDDSKFENISGGTMNNYVKRTVATALSALTLGSSAGNTFYANAGGVAKSIGQSFAKNVHTGMKIVTPTALTIGTLIGVFFIGDKLKKKFDGNFPEPKENEKIKVAVASDDSDEVSGEYEVEEELCPDGLAAELAKKLSKLPFSLQYFATYRNSKGEEKEYGNACFMCAAVQLMASSQKIVWWIFRCGQAIENDEKLSEEQKRNNSTYVLYKLYSAKLEKNEDLACEYIDELWKFNSCIGRIRKDTGYRIGAVENERRYPQNYEILKVSDIRGKFGYVENIYEPLCENLNSDCKKYFPEEFTEEKADREDKEIIDFEKSKSVSDNSIPSDKLPNVFSSAKEGFTCYIKGTGKEEFAPQHESIISVISAGNSTIDDMIKNTKVESIYYVPRKHIVLKNACIKLCNNKINETFSWPNTERKFAVNAIVCQTGSHFYTYKKIDGQWYRLDGITVEKVKFGEVQKDAARKWYYITADEIKSK